MPIATDRVHTLRKLSAEAAALQIGWHACRRIVMAMIPPEEREDFDKSTTPGDRGPLALVSIINGLLGDYGECPALHAKHNPWHKLPHHNPCAVLLIEISDYVSMGYYEEARRKYDNCVHDYLTCYQTVLEAVRVFSLSHDHSARDCTDGFWYTLECCSWPVDLMLQKLDSIQFEETKAMLDTLFFEPSEMA